MTALYESLVNISVYACCNPGKASIRISYGVFFAHVLFQLMKVCENLSSLSNESYTNRACANTVLF